MPVVGRTRRLVDAGAGDGLHPETAAGLGCAYLVFTATESRGIAEECRKKTLCQET